MKTTDFFSLLLRLSAFYLLISSYEWWGRIALLNTDRTVEGFWLSVLLLSISALVFFILLFKPDWVINFLRHNKGYTEDRINFGGWSTPALIQIGVIFTGLYLSLRGLISISVLIAINTMPTLAEHNTSESYYFEIFMRIFIGITLLRYCKQIVGPINRISKD